MFRMIFLIAASSSALVSTSSLAQSVDDVRCLLLSNAFAQGANTDEAKKAGQAGALFYLGRIDGRWNDAQLRTAIAQQQKSITPAKAGAEMQACMRRVEASYKKLQATSPAPSQKRP